MVAPGSELWWWSGFPLAFVLTCVIEVPAYLVAFRALDWCGPGGRRPGTLGWPLALALATGVNLVSHPLLWAVAQRLSSLGSLLVAEAAVVVLEGSLIVVVATLAKVATPKPRLGWSMLTACGVNALSLLAGLVLGPLLFRA